MRRAGIKGNKSNRPIKSNSTSRKRVASGTSKNQHDDELQGSDSSSGYASDWFVPPKPLSRPQAVQLDTGGGGGGASNSDVNKQGTVYYI